MNLSDLIDDINEFLESIKEGDCYLNSDPKKEYGLQFELYMWLKWKKGYRVVYELSLPNLKKYLDEELMLNEGVRGFSYYPEGSLRPDIVVKLGVDDYACFELKYNEDNEKELIEDDAKCRVYVKQCADVHYAASINLFKCSVEEGDYYPCVDLDYQYSYDAYWDKRIRKDGLMKNVSPYPINDLWKQKDLEIRMGGGEFAEYENENAI